MRLHFVLGESQRRLSRLLDGQGRSLWEVVAYHGKLQAFRLRVLLMQVFVTRGVVEVGACAALSLHFALASASLHVSRFFRVLPLDALLCPVQVRYFFLELSIRLHLLNHFISVGVQLCLSFLDTVDMLIDLHQLLFHSSHGLLHVVEHRDDFEGVKAQQVRIEVESDNAFHAFVADVLDSTTTRSPARAQILLSILAEQL